MAMTLEQLKDENAAVDAEELQPSPVLEETPETEAAEETEVETIQAGESEQEETEADPVEAWMQTEGQTSEAGTKKPSFGGLKRKLKAKIGERDDEIAILRQEIASMKSGAAQPQAQPELAPRPTREQFNYNDDEYDAAVDAWSDARFDAKLAGHAQKQQGAQTADAQKQAMSSSVDQHYAKAQVLVDSGVISEADYLNADSMVRGALDQLNPGKGDSIADLMIERLGRMGEGSEDNEDGRGDSCRAEEVPITNQVVCGYRWG